MCGGGGPKRDKGAERRAEERADRQAEENRQFLADQAASQLAATEASNKRFDDMMAQNKIDAEAAAQASQDLIEQQAADAAAERERIANLKPVAGRQSMQNNLSVPQQPGDFAPPPNPGTGTSKTFNPLSVAPTFVNNNVKPVVRGGAGLTRGGASSVNDKTTIDKTTRIGSAKDKKKATGLNIPT